MPVPVLVNICLSGFTQHSNRSLQGNQQPSLITQCRRLLSINPLRSQRCLRHLLFPNLSLAFSSGALLNLLCFNAFFLMNDSSCLCSVVITCRMSQGSTLFSLCTLESQMHCYHFIQDFSELLKWTNPSSSFGLMFSSNVTSKIVLYVVKCSKK